MMKKILSVFLSIIMMFSVVTNVFAQNQTKVFLNEESLEILVKPVIVKDRMLLPLRPIVESMGADIYWHEPEQSIIIVKNEIKLFLTIGENKMSKLVIEDFSDIIEIVFTGEYTEVHLDAVPIIVDGQTYLPVRAVCEALGATVLFKDSTLLITYPKELINMPNTDKTFFDEFINFTKEFKSPFIINQDILNSLELFTDSAEAFEHIFTNVFESFFEVGLDSISDLSEELKELFESFGKLLNFNI